MTNKKKTKTRKKKKASSSTRKKFVINNVNFSKYKSRGTRATIGNIGFHYQNYLNIDDFFNTINLKNLSKTIYFIDIMYTNEIKIIPKKIFIDKRNRFTICVVNVISDDNHANICLIDNYNKKIEFFEPHGYRRDRNSGYDDFGVVGMYHKKKIGLKNYFKISLPNYKFYDVVSYNRKTDYQTLKDPENNTGFCITWCILFAHYRCINPDLSISILMKHISKYITTTKLLKYAKFIEETIKF